MVGVFIMLKGKIPREASPAIRASALALALTLGGYFLIYLITPYDIYWHLRFSLKPPADPALAQRDFFVLS